MGRMLSDNQLSTIARAVKGANTFDVAVLEDERTGHGAGEVYYATYQPGTAQVPYSAIVMLIQGVYEAALGFVPKGKICSTAPPTDMCTGMAQIFGKPCFHAGTNTAVLPNNLPAYANVTPANWVTRPTLDAFQINALASPNVDVTLEAASDDTHQGYATVHRIYMMGAFLLSTQRTLATTGGTINIPGGKNIAAILVSPQGRILACGVNTNNQNGTLHGEVNMLQSYYRDNQGTYAGLPDGCRIYTTLEPCAMCAGMIYRAGGAHGNYRVYYGQIDPPQLAQQTALSLNNKERLLSHGQTVSHYTGTGNLTQPRAIPPIAPGGPKAVKVYQKSGLSTYAMTHADYSKQLETDKVTNFLQLSAADYTKKPAFTSGMTDVAASLLRKLDRNTNPATALNKAGKAKTVNQNVLRVVQHVGLFLRSKGVPNF